MAISDSCECNASNRGGKSAGVGMHLPLKITLTSRKKIMIRKVAYLHAWVIQVKPKCFNRTYLYWFLHLHGIRPVWLSINNLKPTYVVCLAMHWRSDFRSCFWFCPCLCPCMACFSCGLVVCARGISEYISAYPVCPQSTAYSSTSRYPGTIFATTSAAGGGPRWSLVVQWKFPCISRIPYSSFMPLTSALSLFPVAFTSFCSVCWCVDSTYAFCRATK